ncbi:MAG: VanZ family protein [Chloroflexi bacterium]|nr:VanZ family protein [Chloroflexota bacterium]
MRSMLWRWGPALAIMIAIFIASSQPSDDLPNFGLWDLLAKKGGHMIGYGLLAAAMLRGARGSAPLARAHVAWAFALTVLYAMSDEHHQSFVAGRGASAWDVGVDAAGAMLGLAVRVWRRSPFPRR